MVNKSHAAKCRMRQNVAGYGTPAAWRPHLARFARSIEVPRPLETLNFLVYLITFVILGVPIYIVYIELLYTDKAEILFNLKKHI